ncbi:MAG: hypothetical protein R3C10_16095 [Pirellulales bacterium]
MLEASGRSVPIFSDKHLSYRWDWAREMYDTSRRIGAPLMAGSSVPLAQRFPVMEIPSGAKLTDAVSIHGGGVESYDIHGLEVLQSIVESRAGGDRRRQRAVPRRRCPLGRGRGGRLVARTGRRRHVG